MSRILIAILALIASIAIAHAFGLGLGNRFGKLGAQSGAGTVISPIQGALMLEDGTSFLLLEDASSHLCLEGGC